MAKKVRIASRIKSQGDIEIDCMGGAEVLDPIESEGTGGIGGVEEAGSGTMSNGAAETGI